MNFSPMHRPKNGLISVGSTNQPRVLIFKKLQNLSGQHIAAADDAALLQEILAYRDKSDMAPLADEVAAGLGRALYCVKDRAKTFGELLDKSTVYFNSAPLGN